MGESCADFDVVHVAWFKDLYLSIIQLCELMAVLTGCPTPESGRSGWLRENGGQGGNIYQ